jgi:hypothetical protein
LRSEPDWHRSTTQHLNRSTSALGVRFGFGEADNFTAFLPLTAFLEQFDPLETLQNVALRGDGAGSS